MTTLTITPNWKNKSAKFKGAVAAGEHVSVTIQNENSEGEPFIGDASTLRLRVVNPCNGRMLAIFPEPVPEGETPEEWDSDLSPLRCTLNLNTVQMLKAVSPAANVPLLFVLDDYENKTLYFKEQFHVEHWPRLRGEEEPTDLDNYKDLIAEFNARLDGFGSRITAAENAAQSATENASTANDTADEAKTIANEAVDVAQQAKEAAETSQESAAASATAAQNAAEAAIAAAESINNPDATLTEEGVAADAKATGDAIAVEESRAKAAEAAEETRAKGVESGLRTDLTAAQKAIDDEAILRAAADADLEARKADKTAVAAAIQAETSRAQTAERALTAEVASAQSAIADRYTKTEVDTKIAGVQTFGKAVVQTLPDLADADDKTIYLVPRADSEAPDLCDEYVVVAEAGVRRWERIGAKAVDLTLDNAVTRTSSNGVKSSGIWSAIWGALSALPTGFASLYDWCVAQIAKLRDKLDLAVYERGCAVSFPAGYSVTYGSDTYTAPSGGETIELFGPISSTAVPQYNFWVPYEYKDATDFDPQAQTVWCLFGSTGNSVPAALMYGTGASYNIANWDTEAPTLALSSGEATGGEPTMTRPLGATGDTLAKVSQMNVALAGKLDKSGGTVTGGLAIGPNSNYSAKFESDPSGAVFLTLRDDVGNSLIIGGGKLFYQRYDWQAGVELFFPSTNGTLALTATIPYDLGTPIVIDTASSEVVEGETVYYGAATLADRAANIVQVTAATPLDELRITFPAATSGKVRDFGLRVEIGTGSAALAAPALVPIAPTGETIKLENNAAEIPALADGTATAKGVTLLYFSETAPGVFVVKGEQVEEVA